MIFRQYIRFSTCSQHRRNAVNHVCKWHVNRKICSYQRCSIFTTRFQIFRKPMHKELQFCWCKHSMLDPVEEPRHSAPNLYTSDLTPWELNMAASSQWISDTYFFKLYTTYSSRFWPFLSSLMVSIYPVVKAMHHIYIYIYIYACKG